MKNKTIHKQTVGRHGVVFIICIAMITISARNNNQGFPETRPDDIR